MRKETCHTLTLGRGQLTPNVNVVRARQVDSQVDNVSVIRVRTVMENLEVMEF